MIAGERAHLDLDRLAPGWTGKIPSSGDFVSRRVPAAFYESWNKWLAAVLAGSRWRLGEHWREAFLRAPAWRFVLARGLVGEEAWAGLLVPSVDSVGRYYPLTLVCGLPVRTLDPVATLHCARPWYAEIESIALGALAPSTDAAAIDAALASKRFPENAIAAVASPAAKPVGAWFIEDSEVFTSRLLVSERLPTVEQYCEMLTGEPFGSERRGK